jgi:short-subunit dehydrogenase
LWASSNKLEKLGFSPVMEQEIGLMHTLHSININNDQKTVLITGGSSGIGKSLAIRAFAEGYKVILVVKDLVQIKKLNKYCFTDLIQADLSKDKELENAFAIFRNKKYSIDILINNAGIGKRAVFWKNSQEDWIKIIKVNCVAPLVLMHSAVSAFMNSNSKKSIINISSSAAFQPLPYMATYSASKAMLLNLSEAVAEEIRRESGTDIELITICPSGTKTNFQRSSGVKKNKNEKLLSPDFVANSILSTIGKGSKTIVIGKNGIGMNIMARILPRILNQNLWGYLMYKMR